jgi:phospholipase/carboxylesterase
MSRLRREAMEINPSAVLWSVPEAERAGRPTLVMLHGHRMNERVGFELRHHLPAELVFASVRGPRQASGGGYAWFPMDSSFSLEAIDHSAAAVLSWLDKIELDGPVGVLGFSQGVATAFQMVRQDPTRFAYAVNLSGGVVPLPGRGDAELAARRLPVFWGRGDKDSIIPALVVESTRWWLRRHTDLTERVYPGLSHNVSVAELADLAEFVRVHT